MAPCVPEKETEEITKISKVLELGNLRKAIPVIAFEKSLMKSCYYLVFDYTCWFASLLCMIYLSKSGFWDSLSQWQQVLASLAYWNVSGFFMWCLFVVGHDCGHSTFSNSELLNDIVGHLVHGSILVPFYPWQLTHRRHHMYHNHMEKDYSFPWYDSERLKRPDEGLARLTDNNRIIALVIPFVSWPLYLFAGIPDGCHIFPFAHQRMWKESSAEEYTKCFISASVVFSFMLLIAHLNQYSLASIAYYYGGSLVILGWWLITVTYLQHHGPETLSYQDGDWKFVDAAFETVDRKFGYGLDYLHHHITDGHVAHHLFFTKIPHYNLPIATEALKKYLNDNQLGHLYRSDDTSDYFIRVYYYLLRYGLVSEVYTKDKKVTEESQSRSSGVEQSKLKAQ